MKQINDLWPERLQAFVKEVRRYFKYMFNDHMKFVLIFGGGAVIYYYSQWVKGISADFPTGFIMAAVLAVFLTASPILTLLKEADMIYLLPLEEQLTGYFKKGIRISFILQAYLLLLVLAACMPLYYQTMGAGFSSFAYLFAVLLILKYWNIRLNWETLKIYDASTHLAVPILRFALNAAALYLIITEASWWFILSIFMIMAAFTFYIRSIVKTKTLKWELLINKEESRMQIFYRTANLFTDVPHIKSRVWRLKWLDPLFRLIPYENKNSFQYLYARTLVRTSEYSGLITRLTLIAMLLLFFITNMYVAIGVSLLFIYLTGFQILPMYRRFDPIIWIHLYPVADVYKRKAFFSLMTLVLTCQGLLFGLVTLANGHLMNSVIVLIASLLFAFLFSKQYAPSRIRKMEQQ